MVEIVSFDADGRLNALCANCHVSFEWFLNAIKDAKGNLQIQRGIIGGSKAYATLRADLKRGCLLPPVVVAINTESPSGDLRKLIASGDSWSVNGFELDDSGKVNTDELKAEIGLQIQNVSSEDIYIIDGLQRSNAIMQVSEELVGQEREAFMHRRLRLEVWIDIPFNAIAYRMLVLNAGQKPMSIKHQIEILSTKLGEQLGSIEGIDVFTSTGGRRRSSPGQFQLAKLAQAFQAWLQGQPNLDLRNTVMEQMLVDTAIETLGESLEHKDGEAHEGFKELVSWIVEIDRLMPQTSTDFFGNETVLLGLAAAVGAAAREPEMHKRAQQSLQKLSDKYHNSPDEDHLAVRTYEDLRKGFDVSKVNVGQATRDLVYGAFQEFFIANGLKRMDECWRFSSGRN